MTTPDWTEAPPRSTPRLFDWALVTRACPAECNDWNHGHEPYDETIYLMSSKDLEVLDDDS